MRTVAREAEYDQISLEQEIIIEERLALAEQAEADRMLAIATAMAARSRTRLVAVTLARATLDGEPLPLLERHEVHGCRESWDDTE